MIPLCPSISFAVVEGCWEWRAELARRTLASRVFVVILAVEEIRNNLEHRSNKADFIANLSTEEPHCLSFCDSRPFLFVSKSVLPCCVRLVPVVRWDMRCRKMLV
jgi:hypothetical protein